MTKYRIQVDCGWHGFNKYGNILTALYWFIKTIDSGACIKITKIK